MDTLFFTIFSRQKNHNRAHMLFQYLSGFEPIFYTTHTNEEPKKFGKKKEVHMKLLDIQKKYVEKIGGKMEIHIKFSRKVKKYVTVPGEVKKITYLILKKVRKVCNSFW